MFGRAVNGRRLAGADRESQLISARGRERLSCNPLLGLGPESRHSPQGPDLSHRGLSLPDLGRDVRLAVGVFATGVRVFRTEVCVMPAGVGAIRISIAVPGPWSGRLGSRCGWRRPWPGSLRISLEMGSVRGGTGRPRAAGPTDGARRRRPWA
jgi:hypothetical protein